MTKIKIINEFLHSPIWTYEDGIVSDDLSVVENDEVLQALCEQATEKEIMLDLITRIVTRLEEINDGSFVVEDLETERLKAL